jgi:predicted lipase
MESSCSFNTSHFPREGGKDDIINSFQILLLKGSTVMLKLSAVKMDDSVLTATWDVNTKYRFVNTASELIATSLQELIGISGHAEGFKFFNIYIYRPVISVNLHLVIIKNPCFIDSNKEKKMAMVSDGFYKAQMKIPADMKLNEQFHLTKAGILWTGKNYFLYLTFGF